MEKKLIIKKYKLKLKELDRHNKLYYDKSRPIFSDAQFDILKREIIELEQKYSFLKNKNSPNKIVGYKPSKSFDKFKHKVPMLSLYNAFDKNDLIIF